MNEHSQRDIMVAVIVAAVSIAGTWFVGNINDDLRLAKLGEDKGKLVIQLDEANKKVGDLTPALERERTARKESDDKYRIITTVVGRVINLKMDDTRWHVNTLNKGDQLNLRLMASNVSFKLNRVTDKGAVFNLEGCERPAIFSDFFRSSETSDGAEAFVLDRKKEISIGCCSKGNAECYLVHPEALVVKCDDFDITRSTATLHYRRVLFSASPAQRLDELPERHIANNWPQRGRMLRAQQRLKDLGFDPGPLDGRPGMRTEAALRLFQSEKGLLVTGELDEATHKALELK